MKKLKFTKVKIVKCVDDVSYNENIPFNIDKVRAAYKRISDELRYFSEQSNHASTLEMCRTYDKIYKRYEATRKHPGKVMHIENPRWMIVNDETGERIKFCDSIEQAKRYCIKNDLDFGMF